MSMMITLHICHAYGITFIPIPIPIPIFVYAYYSSTLSRHYLSFMPPSTDLYTNEYKSLVRHKNWLIVH